MSILPDMGLPNTMSEAEYAALPEGVARRIEVVHGYVIVCESLTPQHQQVARRLATAFETSRPKEPCTRVQMETDVVLWHVPKYTFRRPDVVEQVLEHGVVLTHPFKVAVPFEELVE
jgi:Putative restriction endonuclease